MIRYKSDFPNQVHQLNVSLSKHYYLLNDNSIKWQANEFDINWMTYTKTSKKHLVTYILRDHFSNCFYAELHSVDKMPLIHEFLFNAWTQKQNYPFFGAPTCLIVPNSTQLQFPSLQIFFTKVNQMDLQTPTSGFSSAVVSIRAWERFVKYFTDFYNDCKTLSQFQNNIQLINNKTNTFGSSKRKDNNLQKWIDNSPHIIDIANDKKKFITFLYKATYAILLKKILFDFFRFSIFILLIFGTILTLK